MHVLQWTLVMTVTARRIATGLVHVYMCRMWRLLVVTQTQIPQLLKLQSHAFRRQRLIAQCKKSIVHGACAIQQVVQVLVRVCSPRR